MHFPYRRLQITKSRVAFSELKFQALAPTSKNFRLRLQNDLVSLKMKIIVLFVQLY